MSKERALLRDEVYATLRERIVRGELRSGERLRVRELAVQLGVSRTPLREALRRLEDEGLVEAAASRWTRVAEMDLQQAARVYAILAALERLAIFAGPFDDGEIGVLRSANDRLEAAIDVGEAHEAYLADRDFHDALIRHAANDELTRIVAELRVKTRLVEHELFGGFATAGSSVAEHADVVDALVAGDPARAADAIEANHRQGLARLTSSSVERGASFIGGNAA